MAALHRASEASGTFGSTDGRSRLRGPIAGLLLAGLAWLATPAAQGQAVAPFTADDLAHRGAVHGALTGDRPQLALFRLPEAAGPAMISILWGVASDEAKPLPPDARSHLLAELRRRPETVVRWVEGFGDEDETTAYQRTRALRLLGEIASPDALGACLILLDSAAARTRRSPVFVLHFRKAFRAAFAGGDGALGVLGRRWDSLSSGATALLIRELTKVDLPADRVMQFLLQRGCPGLLYLEAIEALWRRGAVFDGGTLVAIRRHLETGTVAVRSRAAVVAGMAHDLESVPRLLALLESPHRKASRAALEGLRRLSGRPIPLAPDRWRRWFMAEELWYAEFAEATLESLRSSRSESVARALKQVRAHRLYRDEFLPAVESLLGDASAAVRGLACQALMELDAPGAPLRLAHALNDPDDGVRRVAHTALTRSQGLRIPPDSAAWIQALTSTRD